MSQRDKEIGIGDIDQIAVDEPQPARPAASPGTARKRAPAKPRAVAAPAASSSWMILSLLLLVIVLVLSVWFYREVSALKNRVDNEISQSSQQLHGLASQLSATDETLGQTEQTTQETLKFHESEIRKLWDVSNKRNKTWIQENQSAVSALKKQLADTRAKLTEAEKKLAQTDKTMAQLALHAERSQTRLDVLAESLKQADNRLLAQQRIIDQTREALPVMQKLAALDKQEGDLKERLHTIQEAIRSFDIYRREVNTRLNQLEGK